MEHSLDHQLALTYDQDGLSTIHNADFLKDPRFQRALKRAAQAHFHYPIEWRIHVVLWAAQNGMRIEGDFVECGVNRGFTTSAVLDYLNWNDTHNGRRFYLMDTFHGLVESLVNAQERAIGRIAEFKDIYTECYEHTRQNFAEFDDVVLIRGTIPDSLSKTPATKVAFLHIDMNCALPEVAALQHFWPKMTPGAIVVLDDYAYHGYLPQKEAIDALGHELGFTVLSLPTGGGMIIKQKNFEVEPKRVSSSPRSGNLLDRLAHWLRR
jgi:hypothetical protein